MYISFFFRLKINCKQTKWYNLVRVLMFHNRVNPAYLVYFIGIHFSYIKFNEEFENPCLKNFPTLRHRHF